MLIVFVVVCVVAYVVVNVISAVDYDARMCDIVVVVCDVFMYCCGCRRFC